MSRAPGTSGRIRTAYHRLDRWHERWLMGRWRRAIAQDARQHDDVLHAVALLDALGVEHPLAYETLDAVPHLVGDLHEWHQRLGRASYGDPAVCC